MGISAYRLCKRSDGTFYKRVLLRSPDWPAMEKWLRRTHSLRAGRPQPVWVEASRYLPATLIPLTETTDTIRGLRATIRALTAELETLRRK